MHLIVVPLPSTRILLVGRNSHSGSSSTCRENNQTALDGCPNKVYIKVGLDGLDGLEISGQGYAGRPRSNRQILNTKLLLQ